MALYKKLEVEFMFRFTCFLIFFVLLTGIVFAQYEVFYWGNFEDAVFPGETVKIGPEPDGRLSIVDLDKVSGMPHSFREYHAASETGHYGLELKNVPAKRVTGIAFDSFLNREKLGVRGRALFQADFFIPSPDESFPRLAVLAMRQMPPGKDRPKAFYRFGLTGEKTIYFSYLNTENKDAEMMSKLYKHSNTFIYKLARPAWHRFALVFEGKSTIHCFIDGRELPFSPIEDASLKQLQVGLMMVDDKKTYSCYVDNLSIQWSPDNVPLPESPYSLEASASLPPLKKETLQWLSRQEGIKKAASENKSMLVYFQVPQYSSTEKLDQIFETSPSAKVFLQNYVPIKIDVNQLQGGVIAREMKILKGPTMMILSPSGKELKRAIFKKGDNWENVEIRLNVPDLISLNN
jgi:hypothetical protein